MFKTVSVLENFNMQCEFFKYATIQCDVSFGSGNSSMPTMSQAII